MNRSKSKAGLALLLCALYAPLGDAHDLITSESAERYLMQIARELQVIRSKASPAARAEANFVLGRSLDEIRDLLNRDLAAHGRLQGLVTEYLVREIKRQGVALEPDSTLGRYPAQLPYYREYLQLLPNGPHAADARFAILQASFYDSFDSDPLTTRAHDWQQLQREIALGQALERQSPNYSQIEEARFILSVLYTRAARTAPDAATAAQHAGRARSAIADFQMRYPESLRAAALPLLLESLPH